ncbi:aminopeptidase [Candidatus Woesearchaeota archaeon CG10_big_fil_rev_8_21_14_0_10_44_13]|nr:MAG: aminopeptidase [Candidatus Woesearchaeota archaeon CG10_big_fil_rev_8_21_14_0_10_44_13]
MTDPRAKKLAEIFVNYSVRIKKGDTVEISCGPEAKPLVLEISKLILKKGAIPLVRTGIEGYANVYYKYASNDILKRFPKIAMYEAKNTQASISIGTETNTKELSGIDPKKMAIRSKVTRKLSDHIVNKNNWVIFEYPTNALAQDAEMSLEDFEDFVYNSCLLDWKKEARKQKKIVNLLHRTKKVRIKHKDTDLTFSIKGKKAKECAGTRNMPDGEVFTEPVKHSVNGYIRYSFPAIKGGREVDGIRLEFRNGKVVKATAEKNENYLNTMIKMDPGASYIGEFGIGLNYGIKRFVKQILFDEKIGGTIHFALGRAYKETGGENKSALHWDMIKDMRNGGEVYFDDKLVMKNGKWKGYS